LTAEIKEKHELRYGEGMYTIENGYDISYFIKGEYEITDPIVNTVTRPVEYTKNKDRGLEISLPNQYEITSIMNSICDDVKNGNWFTRPDIDGQEQFTKLEAHIRKAITKYTPDMSSKIGLVGELFLLHSFLESQNLEVEEIIRSWSGHSTKSRDFIFGDTCIEIKTTTGNQSTHMINNLNQVDPRDDDGGVTRLFLGSIGIEFNLGGLSIVDLTNKIINKIEDEEVRKKFLNNLKSYGVNTIGYDHERMNDWEQFNQKFSIIFSRFYDMGDENIKLIRFSDVTDMIQLNEKTVSYQITLEENISGSINNPMQLEQFMEFFLSKSD
tara:strand:+ start:6503 stop:7480 length:978 start_codon:yes stop_codon:yes gene_type:complete